MIIFAEINQQTMKKILLLLAASLVLFTGCKKEDTELMENGPSVTHEYPCSKCGAKYSVTCKSPNMRRPSTDDENVWILYTNPSWGEWTVVDEFGQSVPRYEASHGKYMYFICTCEEKSKEFNIDEFKTQTFKP